MSLDSKQRDQVNKRFTLNWLIQGAAQHAGMTAHHMVRDELDAMNPRLLRLYDQYALINLLQYWHLEAAMIFGWPPRFWKRAGCSKRHPFYSHPLLPKFGGLLAEAGRRRALERCREKGLTRLPILFSFQVQSVVGRLAVLERPHRARLVDLARRMTSTIWDIPLDRLDARLGRPTPFGTPIRVRNFKAAFFRAATVGLGGVVHDGDRLKVVGAGTNWQLLTKELVKGTAELICLHGMCDLADDDYAAVVEAADHIEYEAWMLQTGGELWRRLLAVSPADQPIAQVLMHLSRLPAEALHALIAAVIERPEWAGELLAGLGAARDEQ